MPHASHVSVPLLGEQWLHDTRLATLCPDTFLASPNGAPHPLPWDSSPGREGKITSRHRGWEQRTGAGAGKRAQRQARSGGGWLRPALLLEEGVRGRKSRPGWFRPAGSSRPTSPGVPASPAAHGRAAGGAAGRGRRGGARGGAGRRRPRARCGGGAARGAATPGTREGPPRAPAQRSRPAARAAGCSDWNPARARPAPPARAAGPGRAAPPAPAGTEPAPLRPALARSARTRPPSPLAPEPSGPRERLAEHGGERAPSPFTFPPAAEDEEPPPPVSAASSWAGPDHGGPSGPGRAARERRGVAASFHPWARRPQGASWRCLSLPPGSAAPPSPALAVRGPVPNSAVERGHPGRLPRLVVVLPL